MYKNIFKSILLLSSLQAVSQENLNDVSENYFTENDTVKKLKEDQNFNVSGPRNFTMLSL